MTSCILVNSYRFFERGCRLCSSGTVHILKLKAVGSFEVLVTVYQLTLCLSPENLHFMSTAVRTSNVSAVYVIS
jgi:hypothetical protein